MISVEISNVSKRYQDIWIIKNMTLDIPAGKCIGISGINGSGKSTLLKMISGFLSPSKGEIKYASKNGLIPRDMWYQYLSMAGPYTDVIHDFSLSEMFHFHKQFKPMKKDLNYELFFDLLQLDIKENKTLSKYSSGMKQKVQLALALLSDTPLLLLDEPTSFLDEKNKAWFYELLGKEKSDKTVVVASNEADDFVYCEDVIQLN